MDATALDNQRAENFLREVASRAVFSFTSKTESGNFRFYTIILRFYIVLHGSLSVLKIVVHVVHFL